MPLCKYRSRFGAESAAPEFGWVNRGAGTVRPVDRDLAELLRMAPEIRDAVVRDWSLACGTGRPLSEIQFLAPVDRQEIWAAGVTYARSRDARMEESRQQDVYDRVYNAERPEVFYKASAERCIGPDGTVAFRHDSSWNVPEPELAIFLDTAGRIAGYAVGNDVSSRSIEGENPLYLPQAKVYADSCALGPWILFPHELPDPMELDITMRIERPSAGGVIWSGDASTDQLHRTLEELADCVFAALDFPSGAVLLTGTCIVPPAEFTLAVGDVVTIEIAGIGSLTNDVRMIEPRGARSRGADPGVS